MSPHIKHAYHSESAAWVLGTFAATSAPPAAPRFYVDLAANHPVNHSTTYDLDVHGWRGLCIEPNPLYAKLLREQRSCTIAQAAVDSEEREVSFNFGGGAMGGIEDERFDTRRITPGKPKRARVETLRTRTLQDVLEQAHAPRVIDHFNLDVEGAESAALPSTFPWDKWVFLTMTIERPPPDLAARPPKQRKPQAPHASSTPERFSA